MIELDRDTLSLVRGGAAVLSPTVRDAAGKTLNTPVSWASSDISRATVSVTGVVTGVATGTAVIVATSDGMSATARVTVKDGEVVGASGATIVALGGSVTLNVPAGAVPTGTMVTVEPAEGTTDPRLVPGTAFHLGPANLAFAQPVTVRVRYERARLPAGPPERLLTLQRNDAAGWVEVEGSVAQVPDAAVSAGVTRAGRYAAFVAPFVRSVQVTPTIATLEEGETQQLTAEPRGDGNIRLAGRDVAWASSNPALATVSPAGLVTAVATGGPVTFTATIEGVPGEAQFAVTVARVATVTLAPTPATIQEGESLSLSVTMRDRRGGTLSRPVAWNSSAPLVATVSSTGVITGITRGAVVITATSDGVTATRQFTVVPAPVASIVVSPPAATVTVGGTVQLSSKERDAAGRTLVGRSRSWSSSTITVATVTATGLVTVVSPGTATITVTSEGVSASAVITGAAPNIPVHTVTVSPAAGTIDIGRTLQLVAVERDVNGNVLTGRTRLWASSAPAVATVSATGLVSGVAIGSATVSVQVEGRTATANITVATGAPILTVASGDNQSAVVFTTVAVPPSVRVTNSSGAPIPGVSVTFAVASGGGTVTGALAVTNASGMATLGSWRLGTVAGGNSISVSASGATPVTVTATGRADVAATVAVSAGDAQKGPPGAPTTVLPRVTVRDRFGNLVAGAPVTFVAVPGTGTLSGGNTTTSSAGTASPASWVLGTGANVVSATTPGVITPAVFSATGVSSTSGFHVDLRFTSVPTSTQLQVFNAAVTRWENLITGDLPGFPFVVAANDCVLGTPTINELLDDLIIQVKLGPIDGAGGILGQAGPCKIRTAGFLTALGVMQFDTADLQMMETSGTLGSVILHEMGHVLGFGTLWTLKGLLANPSLPSSPGADTHFTGLSALAGFNAVGGATYTGGAKVPVENAQGGPGSQDGHWREAVLVNELMTPFTNAGPMPLSAASVRALEDLGYVVNASGADPFFISLSLIQNAKPGIELKDDILRLPLVMIDAQGRTTSLPPRRP